jgi:hypothetical protein
LDAGGALTPRGAPTRRDDEAPVAQKRDRANSPVFAA